MPDPATVESRQQRGKNNTKTSRYICNGGPPFVGSTQGCQRRFDRPTTFIHSLVFPSCHSFTLPPVLFTPLDRQKGRCCNLRDSSPGFYGLLRSDSTLGLLLLRRRVHAAPLIPSSLPSKPILVHLSLSANGGLMRCTFQQAPSMASPQQISREYASVLLLPRP